MLFENYMTRNYQQIVRPNIYLDIVTLLLRLYYILHRIHGLFFYTDMILYVERMLTYLEETCLLQKDCKHFKLQILKHERLHKYILIICMDINAFT